MTRTPIATVFLVAILNLALQAPPPASAEEPARSTSPVVVELFTSQGCSSCPPADQLLAGLNAIAEKHGLPVYCLSFHVDYWDSLGWKDPYSAEQFTKRQHRYAAAFGSRKVYTPQMIVNGETEFVGSRANDARQAIEAGLAEPSAGALSLKAKLSADQTSAVVEYQVNQSQPGALLNVAVVQKQASNQIPRGENSGRELAHVQVVRTFQSIALKSDSGSLEIDVPTDVDAKALGIVAYVQDARSMQIRKAIAADF